MGLKRGLAFFVVVAAVLSFLVYGGSRHDVAPSAASAPGYGYSCAGTYGYGSNCTTVTLAVSPTIGVWGTTFTLAAKLNNTELGCTLSGQTLTLYQRPRPTSTWTALATRTTDSCGNAVPAVQTKPSKSTGYKAEFTGGSTASSRTASLNAASSNIVTAYVRVGIPVNPSRTSLPLRSTVNFGGRVLPPHPGQKVGLQVFDGKNKVWIWANRTATLSSTSGFTLSYANRSYRGGLLFRVVYWTQDSEHLWNLSRRMWIVWT